MKIKHIILIIFVILPAAFLLLGCQKQISQAHFEKDVKVALRDAGHKLLLLSQDSTSLMLPIKKTDELRYELLFENKLAITPDSLVNIVSNSLNKINVSKPYIVEVFKCNTSEVTYSFKITGLNEKDIIPCLGRNLPNDCYSIQVLFLENQPWLSNIYIISGFIIVLLILFAYLYLKRSKKALIETETNFSKIGNYKFYKDQNKLVKDAVEIKLSVKECELMAMLSSHQNQIVKREILIKQIWEDHGVYVDRSLDTFISKLRKKFKDDPTINIVNIHGVGYKLEVN